MSCPVFLGSLYLYVKQLKNYFLIFLFIFGSQLFGGVDYSVIGDSTKNPATVNLLLTKTFYEKSHKIGFQSRYFFMNTNNYAIASSDFYANGLNNSLSYRSANLLYLLNKLKENPPPFASLTFAGEYSHLSNLGSSDLSSNNRYEIGLFDIKQPNLKVMGQFTELNLSGRFKKINFVVGRFYPQSFFINAQDGRLRPTCVQGLSFYFHQPFHRFCPWIYSVDFNVANKILVRGSNDWHSINESIGIYPMGVSENGKSSNYATAVNSNNLLFFPKISLSKISERSEKNTLGLLYIPSDRDSINRTAIDLNYSLVYSNSLFLTQMFEIHGSIETILRINQKSGAIVPMNEKSKSLDYGFMVIRQNSLSQNSDTNYIPQNSKSSTFSGFLNFKINKFNWYQSFKIAGTIITNEGRYLMPREWGRDPFYTFMARERNEGLGGVNALTLEYSLGKKFKKRLFFINSVVLNLGYGNYHLPDVKNVALNKYGMPSYQQLNTRLSISLQTSKSHDLQLQFWYIQKFNEGNTYNQVKYELNKVNMSQVNIVVNYSYAFDI